MYTKKNYVTLFLISGQEKELAICSESTACVLTPELHCFSQKETEPMLAKFAMEIRFFLPSLSKAVHGHLDSICPHAYLIILILKVPSLLYRIRYNMYQGMQQVRKYTDPSPQSISPLQMHA